MGRPSHLRRIPNAVASQPDGESRRLPAGAHLFRARVDALRGDRIVLRAEEAVRRPQTEMLATLGFILGYEPTVGDVVLATGVDDDLVVVAALQAHRAPRLVAPDGARAELSGDAISLFDKDGALLVRYADGVAEVAPPRGDLVLRAPAGCVRIEGAKDVAIDAGRDLAFRAARSAETTVVPSASSELPSRVRVDAQGAKITGRQVEVAASRARVVTAHADLIARDVQTSATTISTKAKKIDTTAERIAVHARDIVEEVADLLESKVGRMRALVRGALSVRTQATSIKSEGDTSIDGKRVLLG